MLALALPGLKLLQIAEDIDLKKKDVDGVLRELRVDEADQFPPSGEEKQSPVLPNSAFRRIAMLYSGTAPVSQLMG